MVRQPVCLGRYRSARKIMWVARPGYDEMVVKEIVMNEQTTVAIYEPPVLVEVGEFNEDTLGPGSWGPLDAFQFSYGPHNRR